jgi:glycosyltransferase A (GT-A) superfamily protein (DUF2064 family)
MLRDVLDGAQSVTAGEYVVLSTPVPTPLTALETLARHLPVPWKIVAQPDVENRGARIVHALDLLLERSNVATLFAADAPSADVGPVASASTAAATTDRRSLTIAPTESGEIGAIVTAARHERLFEGLPWGTPAVVETLRIRCREADVDLRLLPAWHSVDAPSDVLRLLEELRAHPERAPRSAQFFVTHP